jgi:type I restriction-modification system DNA methylase subunit
MSNVIINLVKQLHNIMRNRDSITGQKAFYDIIRLLLLRFIRPHLEPNGKLFDMVNPNHYRDIIQYFTEDDVNLLKFELLADSLEGGDDPERVINNLWDMLHSNNRLHSIFPTNRSFNCSAKTIAMCISEIRDTLNAVKFDELDSDVKGKIYEHFINNYAGNAGKEFGQYFTPRNLIHRVFELNKQLYPEMKVNTIYDPCAGTCGFLMEMYKMHSVLPDNIYGGELEPDTFTTGLMNLILATGSVCNLNNHNSLVYASPIKFDWIATNPPFGVKGLSYNDIINTLKFKLMKNEKTKEALNSAINMYPIKTNDGSALFLQHCISKLKNGGVCNIVLPDGQLLNGKNFTKLRKYFVQECILSAVLHVPSGAFEHAGVQTAVLFFSKSERHCTGEVDFYETDKDCVNITKLGTIDFSNLDENSSKYELSWKAHKPNFLEPNIVGSSWEMKKLGEICKIDMGTRILKNGSNGEYPVYGSGGITFTSNLYNRDGKTCKIARFAISQHNCVMILHGKYYLNDSGFTITSKDEKYIISEYLWQYLISIKNHIYELSKGMAQRNLDVDGFKNMLIPVPSIEKQQEIINCCERFDKAINQYNEIIDHLHKMAVTDKEIFIDTLFQHGEIKKLGEICSFVKGKKHKVSEGADEGKYPLVCSSIKGKVKYLDTYDYEGPFICVGTGGAANVRIFEKFNISTDFVILNTTELALLKYIYHFLACNINKIDELFTGMGLKHLNIENFKNMSVPVPSIEKQKEIIDIMEKNELYNDYISAVKNIEKKIEQIYNKKKEILSIN